MKRVISIVYLLWLFSLLVIASTINIEREIRKSTLRVNDGKESEIIDSKDSKDSECNVKNCLTCKGDNKCIRCIEEYVLHENRCYSNNN